MKEDILNAPITGTADAANDVAEANAVRIADIVDRIKNHGHRRTVSHTAAPTEQELRMERHTYGNPYVDRVGQWVEKSLDGITDPIREPDPIVKTPIRDVKSIVDEIKRREVKKAKWGVEDEDFANEVEYAKAVAASKFSGVLGGGGSSEMFRSVDEYRDRMGIRYGESGRTGQAGDCQTSSGAIVNVSTLDQYEELDLRKTALEAAIKLETAGDRNSAYATAFSVADTARIFFDFLSGDKNNED